MKKRDLADRKNRVIVRGEISNHSHIVTGECEIIDDENEIVIKAGNNCAIKHLVESAFLEGEEVWTGEHKDITLVEGETYKVIRQQEYDPYERAIRKVED